MSGVDCLSACLSASLIFLPHAVLMVAYSCLCVMLGPASDLCAAGDGRNRQMKAEAHALFTHEKDAKTKQKEAEAQFAANEAKLKQLQLQATPNKEAGVLPCM